MVAIVTVVVREKRFALLGRLIIIKVLLMRKRLCEIENMHYASHVCMDQTDEFEVTGSGKSDGKALPLGQSGRADASGAIEAAETASRKPRTTHLKSQPCLARLLKGHRMDLVGIECPGDAVTCVNPEFVWGKKKKMYIRGMNSSFHPLRPP